MQRDAAEEEMAADPYVTREYFRFLPVKTKNTSPRNLHRESTRTVVKVGKWKWLLLIFDFLMKTLILFTEKCRDAYIHKILYPVFRIIYL